MMSVLYLTSNGSSRPDSQSKTPFRKQTYLRSATKRHRSSVFSLFMHRSLMPLALFAR